MLEHMGMELSLSIKKLAAELVPKVNHFLKNQTFQFSRIEAYANLLHSGE